MKALENEPASALSMYKICTNTGIYFIFINPTIYKVTERKLKGVAHISAGVVGL